MKKYILALGAACLLTLEGCSTEDIQQDQHSALTVQFSRTGTDYNTTDKEIKSLSAYRFENGILKEIFPTLPVTGTLTCQFSPEQMRGTVYFLANGEYFTENIGMHPETTTEADFLGIKGTAEAMMENGLLMTGQTVLQAGETSVSVALKRSVARIDLDSPYRHVAVHSVKIENICTTGNILENPINDEKNAEGITLQKSFEEEPFANGRTTLFYVPEQTGTGNHEVELMVLINDGWHRVKTTLPTIERNKVYTLKVKNNGASIQVETENATWETGGNSESNLTLKGIVDKENSVLPDDVRVNESCDSVFVPSWETTFKLGLLAEEGAVLRINGFANGAEIQQAESRSLSNIATVSVTSKQKMPGTVHEYIYLDVLKDETLKGRVVIVFQPNPIILTGSLQFDDNSTCDYNKYIDGELGRITLPEGKTAILEFANDEAKWMKLEQVNENEYRILGGWKPNDPLADGRKQTAQLVITNIDGSHREAYTIVRKNWGLPVVNMNGVWWCKYNLRGNVKNYEDQILIGNDPAKEVNLADYLRTCTDEDFLQVLGDQYQAGNPDGLKLTHNGTKFLYEGFKTNNATDFGTLDPKVMAPDGYQIPTYDHFRFFAWGNNCNLQYFNPGAFNNGLGQRLNFWVVERNATFLGQQYGPISFYDFEYGGSHWTICGTGHQWDASHIASMSVLFATYGRANSSWMIDGNPKSTGTGNWIKYTAHNSQKTRIIRCIKTPVEYIYE